MRVGWTKRFTVAYNTSVQIKLSNEVNSTLKKVKSNAKQKGKKANTRRFSECREDSENEISNVGNRSDSLEKMSAPMQLQHRIDVIRKEKKPILQHLINMNIESNPRIANEFVRSPTSGSNTIYGKFGNQSTTFKSTCKLPPIIF